MATQLIKLQKVRFATNKLFQKAKTLRYQINFQSRVNLLQRKTNQEADY